MWHLLKLTAIFLRCIPAFFKSEASSLIFRIVTTKRRHWICRMNQEDTQVQAVTVPGCRFPPAAASI